MRRLETTEGRKAEMSEVRKAGREGELEGRLAEGQEGRKG